MIKTLQFNRQKLMFSTLLTVIALVMGAFSFNTPVQAAPIYQGTGWKLLTSYGIYKLDPNTPYVFTFTSSTNRTRFTPGLQTMASQLRSVGINITVSTTIEAAPANCAVHPAGHIIFDAAYRPLNGQAGYSRTYPCAGLGGFAAGGRVVINTEYTQLGGSWYLPTYMYKNLLIHEAGHAMGLDHPNSPATTAYACPSSSGYRVTMCSPNGGYTNSSAGLFTPLDMNGFKQLKLNASQ